MIISTNNNNSVILTPMILKSEFSSSLLDLWVQEACAAREAMRCAEARV